MKDKFLAAWAALVLIAGLVVGCGDKALAPSNLQGSDLSEVSAATSAAPDLVDDGLFDAASQTNLAGSLNRASASTTTAIEPLTFWRNIARATRTFE